MSGLTQSDVELIEQWAALGGVPDDASTRDVACRLLFKVHEDRQRWIDAAHELLDEVRGVERGRSGGPAAVRSPALDDPDQTDECPPVRAASEGAPPVPAPGSPGHPQPAHADAQAYPAKSDLGVTTQGA